MNAQTERLSNKINQHIVERFMPADFNKLKNFNKRRKACIKDILQACKEAGLVFTEHIIDSKRDDEWDKHNPIDLEEK